MCHRRNSKRATMLRPRWPESTNSPSEIPGTIQTSGIRAIWTSWGTSLPKVTSIMIQTTRLIWSVLKATAS
jgi:hypothetical protein